MEHLIAKALKAYNETFGIDEMEEEFRDQDDKNYRGVVAELMVSFHEKQLAALPNGLPDDDAIENKIQEWLAEEGMNTYSEEYLAGFESAAQLSAEWMRSLAQKTLDEKLECDHRYYSRTGRYMLYEDWCEKCGNYCHEV